jgi:hypothetical protein
MARVSDNGPLSRLAARLATVHGLQRGHGKGAAKLGLADQVDPQVHRYVATLDDYGAPLCATTAMPTYMRTSQSR